MENLEKQCLEKMNNILEKHSMKIIHVRVHDRFQFRLIDQMISDNDILKSLKPVLYTWHELRDIFIKYDNRKRYCYDNTIIEVLFRHYNILHEGSFKLLKMPDNIISRYMRYSNAYNEIKNLDSCDSLEEFLIKMDLMGI
jgi:hypothetical protein